jgi:hypothetical protein
MKRILVFLALAIFAFNCQAQIIVAKNTFLYESPTSQSERIASVYKGQDAKLLTQIKDFHLVIVGQNKGFIHKSCLMKKDIIQGRSTGMAMNNMVDIKAELMQLNQAGRDFVSAGNLLLGSIGIMAIGSGISYGLISQGYIQGATILIIASGVSGLLMGVAGYAKIVSAGNKMSFNFAKEGIGIAFNLYY